MIYAVPNRFKYRHKSQFTVFFFFFFFSAVPNRFKSRHNTRFRNIAFIYFSAVPNRLKYRHVSECMHSNETCSSISFPKPSECMLMRHRLCFFLCISKLFQIPPEYPLKKLRGIIFQNFLCSTKPFMCQMRRVFLEELTVTVHALETLFSLFYLVVPNRFKYHHNPCML